MQDGQGKHVHHFSFKKIYMRKKKQKKNKKQTHSMRGIKNLKKKKKFRMLDSFLQDNKGISSCSNS